MKIVQTAWSCNQKNLLKFNAGWYAPEYHLMGWALSCLQLRKYYNEVVLYADSVATKMLIDTLQLPYSDIKCDLDKLNNFHPQLWALPKIETYSQQDRAFLHIDGDVFIWKSFDEKLLDSELIAQNVEAATNYYENVMVSLEASLTYFPMEIIADRKNLNSIYAYNAGILGGNDIPFFNLYTQKAKEFINNNIDSLSKINVDTFNIFFEQYLFYCLVKQGKKKVDVLLPEIIGDNQYIGFGDFIEVPHNKQYLHLLGVYKRNKIVCEQMAYRLRQDYPEYYYRIIALFKNKGIALKKDYYYFLDQTNEQFLTERYLLLKDNYKNYELKVTKKNNATKIEELDGSIIQLVENAISTIRNEKNVPYSNDVYKEQIKDIKLFESKLITVLKDKFALYSRDYLYARDIDHTQYFQLIFENKKSSYDKKIVADSIIEIIESKFDWTEVYQKNNGEIKLIQQLNSPPSNFYTGVIPECHVHGCSLINIDDLDMLLLQVLHNPITINEVLNEIKTAFDPVEIEECLSDFEMLIIGRIKMALQTKLIKAVII